MEDLLRKATKVPRGESLEDFEDSEIDVDWMTTYAAGGRLRDDNDFGLALPVSIRACCERFWWWFL